MTERLSSDSCIPTPISLKLMQTEQKFNKQNRMYMKGKLLLVAILCLAVIPGFSQNLAGKCEFDFGLNSSSMTWTGSKLGFHAGVRATKNLDSQIGPGFYANAGLFFSLKGGKADLGELAQSTIEAYYLEVPVHIGYKYTVNEDIKLFAEVGPYLDLGLFGNQSSKTIADWEGTKYDKETRPTFDTLRRYDFGLGFRVGAEYKKYVIAIGYDAGIANIYPTNYDDDDVDVTGTVHSSNFYISAGIKF